MVDFLISLLPKCIDEKVDQGSPVCNSCGTSVIGNAASYQRGRGQKEPAPRQSNYNTINVRSC